MSSWQRRADLCVRSMVRFGPPAILWPPGATDWTDADGDWLAEVFARYLALGLQRDLCAKSVTTSPLTCDDSTVLRQQIAW